jgi:hypothetical protein
MDELTAPLQGWERTCNFLGMETEKMNTMDISSCACVWVSGSESVIAARSDIITSSATNAVQFCKNVSHPLLLLLVVRVTIHPSLISRASSS